MTARPAPQPDRDSAPFWDGVRAGQLRLQRCNDCGAWRWPARAICNRCHSFAAEWRAVSGVGKISSWIRTHQTFMRTFADDLPYVTVLVELDEQQDIQLIGGLADPAVKPAIGMRVSAVFEPTCGEPPLVLWRAIGP